MSSPELLALRQSQASCKAHEDALRAIGEDVASMPALDRFDRLEQIGWLPSAEEWSELRRIRNEFTHDYPETTDERFQRFGLALDAATRVL